MPFLTMAAGLLLTAGVAQADKTPAAVPAPAPAPAVAPSTELRTQQVRPLSGGLDRVALVNDNNPELIIQPGILLSTFNGRRTLSGQPFSSPDAHLNVPLQGRFDLFSHHVYAGRPETLDSVLWLGVVAAPVNSKPVRLRVLSGSTALSQSSDPSQPAAPFLPLPPLMTHDGTSVFAGPGSRVAAELLQNRRGAGIPQEWNLAPGQLTTLLALPIPVKGLDPLLNGRNLQLRLESDGPVELATLATFGGEQPPEPEVWSRLLRAGLSAKEHVPTPRGQPGGIVYSRVSGVQTGSRWSARLTDPGTRSLSVRTAPVSWPIASLERGSLGSGQVQTAELQASYPGTAWAAHGNYGVEYDLTLPLVNDTKAPVALDLALESPRKTDRPEGGLRFNLTPPRAVVFRGTVEVSGLDGPTGRPAGRRWFHLVQRQGEKGPSLGRISLAPGQQRQVRVRLIYPADATPPQVLSLLPAPVLPQAAVKQSESVPAPRP